MMELNFGRLEITIFFQKKRSEYQQLFGLGSSIKINSLKKDNRIRIYTIGLFIKKSGYGFQCGFVNRKQVLLKM